MDRPASLAGPVPPSVLRASSVRLRSEIVAERAGFRQSHSASGEPALRLGRREFAHSAAPGRVDLRVSTAVWRRLGEEYRHDPAVAASSRCRDWIDLTLAGPDDVERLRPLFAAAVAANE